MAFISCRGRLTKVLAGAAREQTGSKGGGGRVRLSDVDTRKLAGFQNELICNFILAVDMVEWHLGVFLKDTDGTSYLERELVGLGVDGYQ